MSWKLFNSYLKKNEADGVSGFESNFKVLHTAQIKKKTNKIGLTKIISM